MSELKSSWVSSTEEFLSLREEWTELLQESSTNHLFLTWEWLYTWWITFGHRGTLALLTVRSDNTLLAVVPLMLRRRDPLRLRPFRSLEFIGSGSVGSDYLTAIVRNGRSTDVLPVLSRMLTDRGANLQLVNVERTSAVMNTLSTRLQDRGWRSNITVTDHSPWIDLHDTSWESYFASRGTSHASGIRRKLKKVNASYTVKLALMNTETDRKVALDEMISLHLQRWSGKGGSTAFNTPELIEFHRRFSALALQSGWLRLFVLQLDGVAAASVYAFNYRNVYYYYQSAFDSQFSRYSVGQLIIAKTIQYAIDEGAQEYDFLHGTEKYKYSWATSERELVRIEMYRPGARGFVTAKAMLIRERIKRLVKPIIPNRLELMPWQEK